MNETQEQHARQALKDIWDAAKTAKGNRADDLGRFAGELMGKVSSILKVDFDEERNTMEHETRDEVFERLKRESKKLDELLGPGARDAERWSEIIECVMRMNLTLACPLTVKREQ